MSVVIDLFLHSFFVPRLGMRSQSQSQQGLVCLESKLIVSTWTSSMCCLLALVPCQLFFTSTTIQNDWHYSPFHFAISTSMTCWNWNSTSQPGDLAEQIRGSSMPWPRGQRIKALNDGMRYDSEASKPKPKTQAQWIRDSFPYWGLGDRKFPKFGVMESGDWDGMGLMIKDSLSVSDLEAALALQVYKLVREQKIHLAQANGSNGFTGRMKMQLLGFS